MGFYIRKSVNLGPIRFNLSNSGIGVSTGIKGFRVGTGPRGNYVSMGYGGVSFRQTFPVVDNRRITRVPANGGQSNIEFQDTESGIVMQTEDSSSTALLNEINSKAKKLPFWPFILALTVSFVLLLVANHAPLWSYYLSVPISAIGLGFAIHADRLRKTVVVCYELAPHIESAYQELHNAFSALKACSQCWHIAAKGNITNTHDWKVNAGASTLITRSNVNPYEGAPAYFQCNISLPVLPGRRQKLYFLPDRVLVSGPNGIGAVEFQDLSVQIRERRFIEEGWLPNDSQVVGKTWKYVNKKGGPDRRFNNNREIPIALYDEVELTSSSGLQEMFQLSKTGVGRHLESAVRKMAQAIAQPGEMKPEFVKCPCNNCDVLIEFPVHGVGETVSCPQCGLQTLLFNPSIGRA